MGPRHISGRVEGLDVARAFAGIIMIQGHAYHGWATPEARDTFGYAVTRFLGTLPLPAFLVLAGAAVAWRVGAANERGEDARVVRRRVALRGLQIVLWGYAVNLLFALMDGFGGMDTLLRADVLHVIGLSIAGLALLGIRGTEAGGAPDLRWLGAAALLLGVGATALCPWITDATAGTAGPARYLVGLFAEVPGVTRMPAVPLTSWCCLGVGAALWMRRARARKGDDTPRGAPRGTLWAMAAAGGGAAVVGWLGMNGLLDALGGDLSRSHPAVWLNALDLGGRGVVVLALGALSAGHLRGLARSALLRLGRGSLVAYVFHIPFCYGLLGAPLADRLDMPAATAAMLGLVALSWGAVWGRDGLRGRLRGRFGEATA